MKDSDIFSFFLFFVFTLFLATGIYVIKKRKNPVKTLTDIKQEILLKQGREQFKKLISNNLNIPVTLL